MNRRERRKQNRLQIQAAKQAETVYFEADVAIQAQADEDGPKTPTANITAYNGGPMTVAGYDGPVVIDVAGVEASGKGVPILQNHDRSQILGHGKAEFSESSIELSGVLSGNSNKVEDIVSLAASEFPWQASVGLQPTKIQRVRKGAKANVNGQEIPGPAEVIRAGRLLEVSLVPIGADGSTSADIAASLIPETEVEIVEPHEEQEVQAQPAPVQAAGSADVFGDIEERQNYEARVTQILTDAVEARRISAAQARQLRQDALEQRPNLDRLELQILRDSRYDGPAPGQGSGNKLDGQVLECALGHAVGVAESHYKEEVHEAAKQQFPHGIGLKELINLAARDNGFRGTSQTVTREMLEYAFPPRGLVQASSSPSTYKVSGILSNIANKALWDAFNAVEAGWEACAQISSVRDFKQISTYALTGDFTYKKVAPGGELTHADMGQEIYTNQADTYGRIFGITRHDLVNDDLSAFDRVRSKLGRGAALALNDVFWTDWFEDAATFWAAGRGNYQAGAETALDIDSLTSAELLFRDQTDPDGNPLGVQPAILLVPNALATTGRKLMNDTEMRMTDADTTFTTGNPWVGAFRLVVSSYVGNTNYGGTATNWWLLANPADMPTSQVVFLNGQRTPMVEQASANFDQLGIQLRGYHDFGVNKQEYRGSVMSKGAV